MTGIYPINPDVFTEEDFAPSENLVQPKNLTSENVNHPSANSFNVLKSNTAEDENIKTGLMQQKLNLSFPEVIPIPSCSGISQTKQRKSSKKQHSVIFISTPMKDVLEDEENEKQKKKLKKFRKRTTDEKS